MIGLHIRWSGYSLDEIRWIRERLTSFDNLDVPSMIFSSLDCLDTASFFFNRAAT
jgi:hypothetical protein